MSSSLGRKRGWLVALCLCTALALPLARTSVAHGPAGHGGGGGQPGNGWTVLAPVSYKNLTLFPVRGRDLAGSADYITLDEGIKNGTIIISERGAGQAAARRPIRRLRNGRVVQQNVSMGDGASVNELSLTNKSGKKLLLLSGEVIVGGKQDRIVEEDRIIPPVSVPVSLSVFCVEHGRWQQRAASSPSTRGARNGQVISHPVVASAPENFSSLGAISHPKLRAAAQDKKQQGEVWKEVSANNVKLGTANTTDTYQEVYANKKVSGEMDDYIKALGKEVIQPGVVGVVVARNGELVWVDAFASASLFARYWPKLLKSYVVDAMGDDQSEAKPTVEQARRYLQEREGTVAVAGQAGVYQLVKTEHPRYAIFELSDVSLKTPLRLHFNKMQR